VLPYSPSSHSSFRSPGAISHFRTAPSFHFRYEYGMDRNGNTTRGPRVGLVYSSHTFCISSAVRNPDDFGNDVFGFTGICSGESSHARGRTRRRSDSAPVGQLFMHSPHCTHVESRMIESRSKLMRVPYPLPVWPITLNGFTSEHARAHRSHRMQRS
jgi:hypothetical protein